MEQNLKTREALNQVIEMFYDFAYKADMQSLLSEIDYKEKGKMESFTKATTEYGRASGLKEAAEILENWKEYICLVSA